MKTRPMKKIRNPTQLREKKNLLHLKQLEIEQILYKDWKQLCNQFQPENIFKNNSSEHPKHNWLLKFLVKTIHVVTGKILQKSEGKQIMNSEKSIKPGSHHFSNFFKS